jgi:hypothetical protein
VQRLALKSDLTGVVLRASQRNVPVALALSNARSFQMSETKNQQSRQDMQHGHQNQEPKKGQSPNDPENKHIQQDNSQKQGHNDSKERQQRKGMGTPHDKEGKSTNS